MRHFVTGEGKLFVEAYIPEMRPDTHGEYVMFGDYQKVCDEADRLRNALKRIYYFQVDIGYPPLKSVNEIMRDMARDALRQEEEG
jgi:hypothetical protein